MSIRLTENALERTARLLSSNYGINVVFKDKACHTDGKTIYLPPLPDNAPEDLVDAMQGYLDHETGHILFSDFTPNKALSEDQALYACVNTIEDVRVEQRMVELFPGSEYNLKNAHTWIYSSIKDNWKALNSFEKALAGLFLKLKYEDTEFVNNFIEPEVKEVIDKAHASLDDPKKLKSTQEAVDEGTKLYELLKALVPPPPPSCEGKEGKGTGDPKDGHGKPSVSKGNDLFKSAVGLEAIVSVQDLASVLKQAAKSAYAHNQSSDSTYRIWSTQNDKVFKAVAQERSHNGKTLQSLRDSSNHITNAMRQRLVNSLRAMQQRRWQGGKEEGKLDTRSLYRAFGGGQAIYKQRTDKLTLNTAVAMMVDHSGSMSGSQLQLAGQAAILLGDVFNVIKVPFMVYGYSTEGYYDRGDSGVQTVEYARWGSLWLKIYSEFNDHWETAALKLANTQEHVKENTLDGESLKYGVQRLLARPEKRKIMVVLNDGEPYPGSKGNVGRCQKYLKNVVAASIAKGVEIITFGIHTDNVKHYYPDWVVINNLEDLVKQPLAKIDEKLRKGMYRRL